MYNNTGILKIYFKTEIVMTIFMYNNTGILEIYFEKCISATFFWNELIIKRSSTSKTSLMW